MGSKGWWEESLSRHERKKNYNVKFLIPQCRICADCVASLFRSDDDSGRVSCTEVPTRSFAIWNLFFGLFKKWKDEKSIATSNKTAFWLRKHPERKERNGNENVPTKCLQASISLEDLLPSPPPPREK